MRGERRREGAGRHHYRPQGDEAQFGRVEGWPLVEAGEVERGQGVGDGRRGSIPPGGDDRRAQPAQARGRAGGGGGGCGGEGIEVGGGGGGGFGVDAVEEG